MADKQARYEITADVKGRESITGLANDLEGVSKVLEGDLKQTAIAAATQLRELAKQDAAITEFTRLQRAARDAGAALKAAEKEAANFGEQIAQAGPPTAQEATALRRLQTAADGARATLEQQKDALNRAQADLQVFGISAKNATDAQQRLRQEVALVRETVAGLAPSYQQVAATATAAGDTMNRTHRRIGEGVESISTQLASLQRIYGAFLSLQGAKSMALDLAKTADEAKNLKARLELVTGEGANFQRGWEGAVDVALRTHSALEETGALMGRITQVGKDAGLSTTKAIEQSLRLTETINKSIQLGGASAEASKASVTQLIQGLQSGVLRGDEFNSIMEQSPRLAKALADGLNVTTGELRKLAEAGVLTSDRVISALKSQSEKVATEFDKLPPTVGRALQDLSTQWTLYVADTDKATGASVTAANAINALSSNLRTVAGLLIDVGQATAAFIALRLAQQFLGISTAAQASAAAVAATNIQLAATGSAATAAAAGAGRLVAILATLRTFTLVGLLANIQDIGTWLGETAAKLAGYKDRTQELEAADQAAAAAAKEAAAAREAQAAATQAATEKQFDLSKAASKSVFEFAELTKNGSTAAEAVKKVTDNFDLSKVQGVKDFAATLDKLAADGKISASEFEAAWAQALSGKDLAIFEAKARAAFLGSAREAERLAQVTEAMLTAAVKRAGLEYDVLKGGIGATSRSAINDTQAIIDQLGKLKGEGIDTGRVLTASISKAIQSADSEAALASIRGQIESVRSALGQKVADGLLDQAKQKANELKDALDAAKPGINSVREALKLLGITSDEVLKKTAADAKSAYDVLRDSGTASARELGEAFKKSAEAAIAANKGLAPIWVQAEAAMRGYEIAVDSAGKATLRLKGATDDASGSHIRAANAIDQHRTALEQLNAEREREIAAQEKANDLATRELQLQQAKRQAGTITGVDSVPSFETQAQADAWLAVWKEQYQQLNPFSTNSGGALGNFMYDMTMFEWNKEVDALKLRNTMKGNGNAETSSKTPLEAMASGQVNTINLQLNGQSYGQVNTDPAGAATLNQLFADLARQKGASA